LKETDIDKMKEEGIDKYRINGMYNLEDLCAENFRDIFLEYLNLFSEYFLDDTLEYKEGEKYEDVEIDEFKNLLIQFYDEDNEELIEILANSLGAGNGTEDYFKVFGMYNFSYKEWQQAYPDEDFELFYNGYYGYLDDFNVYILRTKNRFYVAKLPNRGPRDEYGWYSIEIDEKKLKQQIEKELKEIDEEFN
jgi:hypothetical protein